MGRLNLYGQITEINSGVTYNSINKACEELNLCAPTLYKLLKQIDKDKPFIIEYNGYKFSKALNVSILKSEDVQIAKLKEENPHNRRGVSITELHSGKEYSSMATCSKGLGVCRSSFTKTINQKGFYEDKKNNIFAIPTENITKELLDKYSIKEKSIESNIENEDNNIEFFISDSGSVLILKGNELVKKCLSAKDLYEIVKIEKVLA